jgi:DNA processing protein
MPQTLLPKDFPALLSEINDPPEKLYVLGKLPEPELKLLAVVGSRAVSSYGREVVETLIDGLKGYPIGIVSGLAIGTDALAHEAALRAHIYTLAIPGSGLGEKVLYPRGNRDLADRIIRSGGGLLSELEEDQQAAPWTFPKRNRLMAGLTHATLVIEAAEKSGTLITARLAMEYNRDVLAVPGPIFNAHSYGAHMLIRNGATPITSSNDILEALGFSDQQISGTEKPSIDPSTLSDDERRVIALIENPLPRDEVIRALLLPVSKANVLLATLELKGIIIERGGLIRIK